MRGEAQGNKASLANEKIVLKSGGVLPELCQLLGEPTSGEEYNLKDIFYNLAYIHRAYCVTFGASKELFMPIADARFVRKEKSSECWFTATIKDKKYQHAAILEGFKSIERDEAK